MPINPTKATILIGFCLLVSSLHAILGAATIRSEHEAKDVVACCRVWGYDLTAMMTSFFMTLYCIFALGYMCLMHDVSKLRLLLIYMVYMSLLVFFGALINGYMDDNCENFYNSNYPNTLKYYKGTWGYSIGICCVFAFGSLARFLGWCVDPKPKIPDPSSAIDNV